MEKRMYGFVPYNISEIQKGIQFGHGVVEYSLDISLQEEYLGWAKHWKTFIILNGGTSNEGITKGNQLGSPGSMEIIREIFLKNDIEHSVFYEPDLNWMLSSINFIVDARVFDKTNNFVPRKKDQSQYDKNVKELDFTKNITFQIKEGLTKRTCEDFNKWVEEIGHKNIFLKYYLANFKLA